MGNNSGLRSWPVLLTGFCSPLFLGAQGSWSTTNIPTTGRYDDVFFVNADTGWAAGGGNGRIYKTVNGGDSWTLKYQASQYLRSIEFVNGSLGFCGSLDQALYRTTDGGDTWEDISPLIWPPPLGICGLSAPNVQVIYGCGIWSSPASIIRSNDGGDTWTYIDLSSYADALVDIEFVSPDTGFVTGTSINTAAGGIVLRTTDGGASWQTMHTTGVANDIIWKIQLLDEVHCYGSVYGIGVAQDTRMIRSSDGGLTWEDREVADHYTYTEGMGFIDPLHGWVGGDDELFSTSDGGDTWTSTIMGQSHNRFFRIDENTAYLSGQSIYKYSVDPTGVAPVQYVGPEHQLTVRTSADGTALDVSVDLIRGTIAVLDLRATDGRLIDRLMFDRHASGKHQFRIGNERLPSGMALVVLSTNEGLIGERVVVAQ